MRTWRMLRAITLLTLAHTLGASEATAQDTAPGAVGERVRVSTESGAIHMGLVTALSSGALELQEDEEAKQRFSIPLASVTRFEVSRGEKSHAGTVGGIGSLAGAVTGALLGFSAGDDPPLFGSDEPFLFSAWEKATVGFFIGGALGALVGGLVGATVQSERWEEVPLERVSVSFAPQRDGRFGLGLSARF